MSPRVSVVIATYQGEAFVRQTVESVLRQDHPSFELIVVDDGSRDGTRELLRSFGSKLALVEQANQGVAAARNAGAARARGEWIAFLDQDDLWEQGLLSTLAAELERHDDWALVYADSWIVDRAGVRHGRRSQHLSYAQGEVLAPLLAGNFIPIETSLFRRSAFLEVGGFEPRWRFLEDYDLVLRLARRWRVGYVDRVLASYRIHERNLSHDIVGILEEHVALLEELPARFVELGAAERARCAAELARRRGELAWQLLRRLEVARARGLMAGAGAGCPAPLRWKNRVAAGVLSLAPPPLGRWMVGRLPARSLYGLRPGSERR